jgi:general secretion pathway protein G
MTVTYAKRMGWALPGLAMLLFCVFAGGATPGQVAQKQSDQLLLDIMDMHEQLATNEVFLAQANLVAVYLQAAQQSDEAGKVQIYQRVQRLLAKIRRASEDKPDKTEAPSKPTGRQNQAKITAAQAQIANLQVALDTFKLDVGRFPTTVEGLQALLEQPASNPAGWHGPYVRGTLMDPWGKAYGYRRPGRDSEKEYDLYSGGPDGRPDSDDDIKN